jgi:putative SOS response-associated peptidase YedK
MCYNYETMVRRQVERSIHDIGMETTMASLTDEEKRIMESTGGGAEAKSTYPGSENQVIPITTRQREFYSFGFLPDWAKSFNDQNKNFNARTDGIRTKPTWRKAWKNKQRCLVCAVGFYEVDRKTKKRYKFTVKDREEIFFAGIFNHWKDPETEQVHKTFAIITTEPNELVEQVHNRMPVILDKEGEITWLKPNATEDAVYSLLRSYPADQMEMIEAPPPPRKKKGSQQMGLEF